MSWIRSKSQLKTAIERALDNESLRIAFVNEILHQIPSQPSETMAKRFWKKVDIRGEDECWSWKAGKNQYRCGIFYFNGCFRAAPRIAFFLKHGYLPNGVACHRCDNPNCVNPNHIYDGTRSENMLDMYRKGRHPINKKYEKTKNN